VVVGALVLLAPLTAAAATPADSVEVPLAAVNPEVNAAPAIPTVRKDGTLADSRLAEAVRQVDTGAQPAAGIDLRDGRILVEVLSGTLDRAAVTRIVSGLGGSVTGHAGPTLTEALLPAQRIRDLQAAPGIELVRLPHDVSAPVTTEATATGAQGGEAVTKTAVGAWHSVGLTGVGVRVGVVDWFDGTAWSSAAGAGEVPSSPAGTFCRNAGTACDIWSGGTGHGVAVTEAVRDLAPAAAVYLATTRTTSDLQAAVDWFVANGVRVVSRSLTAEYDGPGNGTGPLADVVADAASRGITWLNSAGNAAGSAADLGAYWRGEWRDTDSDDWLEYTADGDELLAFYCGFLNGVRWSDWGLDRTDYDVYVLDEPYSTEPESASEADQSAGALPIENIRGSCSSSNDVDYLLIGRYAPGGGSAGDVLEFMTNTAGIEHWQNPYSAAAPVVDSADPAVLAVGAVDPVLGTTIASYSSQGPTNDGRTKPNLSAAAGFSSHTYPGGFNGTSASTPVAAGAAAVVLQAFPGWTPAELAGYLESAVVDRGVAGPDNVYGAGELRLPPPPAGLSRLSGADRFATSAAISAATFPAGVDTAYVATGLAFPDALSGAPAAALGGNPVLLVTPTAVPSSIAAELTRLAPQRIVILGGTGAVGAAVASQLRGYLS
jgi:hypothetical protein